MNSISARTNLVGSHNQQYVPIAVGNPEHAPNWPAGDASRQLVSPNEASFLENSTSGQLIPEVNWEGNWWDEIIEQSRSSHQFLPKPN